MIKKLICCLGLLSLNVLSAPTADEILKKTDQIRNPQQAFVMEVEIITQGDSKSRFKVFTKDKDKTLIQTLSPKRNLGRNLLMLDTDMWAYIPRIKRAVRVALNQKLSGEAANGDISRMRWHGDYASNILNETTNSWTLDLKALRKGLTYQRILLNVAKKTFRPLKADYQTAKGKLLKTCQFQDYKSIAGAVRPTKLVIQDAQRKDKVSTIIIHSIKVKNLRDSFFKKSSLAL